MYMSVMNGAAGQVDAALITAHWNASTDAGVGAPLGVAAVGYARADLVFTITTDALSGVGILGSEAVDLPQTGWALRLDEVAFPVDAIAHRHTHSGSGWRHLVSGSLRIEAEHDTTIMGRGDSWFEPADSPVCAVALQETGVARFVRCMVIPLADVGRSTFQLCDPKDAQLPRLQETHRHFDHVFQVDAG